MSIKAAFVYSTPNGVSHYIMVSNNNGLFQNSCFVLVLSDRSCLWDGWHSTRGTVIHAHLCRWSKEQALSDICLEDLNCPPKMMQKVSKESFTTSAHNQPTTRPN